MGPFRFFQALMGPDCDAARAFKQGVVEEFAEVWITLSRLGRLESSVLPLRELECEDPDVELGCWGILEHVRFAVPLLSTHRFPTWVVRGRHRTCLSAERYKCADVASTTIHCVRIPDTPTVDALVSRAILFPIISSELFINYSALRIKYWYYHRICYVTCVDEFDLGHQVRCERASSLLPVATGLNTLPWTSAPTDQQAKINKKSGTSRNQLANHPLVLSWRQISLLRQQYRLVSRRRPWSSPSTVAG
jgi:hypothetical protein